MLGNRNTCSSAPPDCRCPVLMGPPHPLARVVLSSHGCPSTPAGQAHNALNSSSIVHYRPKPILKPQLNATAMAPSSMDIVLTKCHNNDFLVFFFFCWFLKNDESTPCLAHSPPPLSLTLPVTVLVLQQFFSQATVRSHQKCSMLS